MSARDHLDTALRHIAQDSFGRRDAPRVILSPDTHQESDGSVTGALEIHIRTRSGEEPLIHREGFTGVYSKADIDNLLARTLSVLLMNHADWPR